MTSTISDEQFRTMIETALKHMSVSDIANGLSVSLPTITRWASGRSSPHPVMREPIKKFLEEKLGTSVI